MRKIILPALAAIILIMGTATAFAAGTTYNVHVAGLACPFCAYGIEKSLSAIDGVKNVETHIKEGIVVVQMAEGETLDEAEVQKAVTDAGFTLEGFEAAAGDQ